jgi:hypothetical protein
VNPTSVVGGAANSTGTVTLDGAAPTNGISVALSSSDTAATVPSSVPVLAGATSATFTLHNPLGSGVTVELASLDLGWPAAAASVVGTILGSVSTQTPTSVTSGGATVSMPIGGGGIAQAKLYTAATIVAITTHIPLITASTVTDTMNPPHVEFEGKVSLAPGGIITLTSTPVQTAVSLPCFIWAEWPA